MILIVFGAILLVAIMVALLNWRHGWFAAMVCGVLQDPFRKMTPGTPAAMTMSVVLVYGVIIIAAAATLHRNRRDFALRFPNVYSAVSVVIIFLVLAAMRGVATFGIEMWKVPAISFLIYCIPIPATLLGYSWLTREEQMIKFFIFYSVLTSIALIGTPLEYLGVKARAIGMVAMPWGFIRHLPGLQIPILSGFYRAPDIMGWHASMLAIIGIIMTMRARVLTKAWPWIIVTGWAFLNCIISGRRKAVYMVLAFALAFFWRYFKRLSIAQLSTILAIGLALMGVVYFVGGSEKSSVYTKGTRTSSAEVFERLEGGTFGSIEQHGIFGAGLGAATQGVRHVIGTETDLGWQEGGMGKLVVELGVPGALAVIVLVIAMMRMMLRISAVGDVEGTTQILRCGLFGIVIANMANFMASAQAYSDPVLTLSAAFYLGALFATATLDEKLAAEKAAALVPAAVPVTA
ncbi:MAG: hypothetical protein DMF56_18165 [Acidobacteria bacterium]|nr:MAG: hypothetical protein DMF56_18165 [Acidobacteriota bacterium]